MTSSALLMTIATHPFQIMLLVAVVAHAARAFLSALPKPRHNRLLETLRLRHAA